jgi:hypothetical protein
MLCTAPKQSLGHARMELMHTHVVPCIGQIVLLVLCMLMHTPLLLTATYWQMHVSGSYSLTSTERAAMAAPNLSSPCGVAAAPPAAASCRWRRCLTQPQGTSTHL